MPCHVYFDCVLKKTAIINAKLDFENLLAEVDKDNACDGAGNLNDFSSVFHTASKIKGTVILQKYEVIKHTSCTGSVRSKEKMFPL